MPNPEDLLSISLGSVVAPAGHGKTELIARTAALGRRTLVLTHTHAGVHALRSRLKRLGVDPKVAMIDTIASWSTRYIAAFPGVGRPLDRMPRGGEWTDIYKGGLKVIKVPAVGEVLRASYDRILVDEYQDCDLHQHSLVKLLSEQLPTIVFGDRMQGIFNFDDSPSVSWDRDVTPHFPFIGTLREPMRWQSVNPELGRWIAAVRECLELGLPIDLRDAPVTYLACESDRDPSPLFHDIEAVSGSVAAIHRYRKTCDQLAKSTGGFYQAIEDVACVDLQAFAGAWDAASGPRRVELLRILVDSAVCRKARVSVEANDDAAVEAELESCYNSLASTGCATFAVGVIECARKHSLARTFRGELIRDTRRALEMVAQKKCENLTRSAFLVRQRISHAGRFMPERTVSTPLLLKGLEFDHVVVPDATHFNSGRNLSDRAKMFYVTISRAKSSLVVASSSPILKFPRPA